METKKYVCYANINSFNSSEGVTDQHMRDFFLRYLDGRAAEIVDVVVDRCEKTKPLARREGWEKVQKHCRAQHIDDIVIPTMQMLDAGVVSLIGLSNEFRGKYGTGFVFLLEDIAEAGENLSIAMQIHSMIRDNSERTKQMAAEMRKIFSEATGVAGEASAMPVYVDYDLYQKAKRTAHSYGEDVCTLVQYLLEFAVNPENERAVNKYVYGVESDEEQ